MFAIRPVQWSCRFLRAGRKKSKQRWFLDH
jgi:hypothetical protein